MMSVFRGEFIAAFGYHPLWPLAVLVLIGLVGIVVYDRLAGGRILLQLLDAAWHRKWLLLGALVAAALVRGA